MKGYRISIHRHGQTLANEEGRYIGITDYPLSDKGRDELENLSKNHSFERCERIYSSPLLRAVQSCRILYPNSEITEVDGLKEMDFGVFEGLKAEEILHLDSYRQWLKGGLDNPPPNGESLRDMTERSYSAIDAVILDMMKHRIYNAAVMTHSGIMMNLLSCFGIPKLKPMEFACNPGEGQEVYVTAMMWQRDGIFEILGKIPKHKELSEQ